MSDRIKTLLIAVAVSIALIVPLFSIPRPTNVSSITWKSELLFSAILLVLLVLVKFRPERSRQEINVLPVILSSAGIGLWSAFSMIWAESWTSALHHSLVWLNYTVILLVTVKLIRDRKGLRLILGILVCTSLIIGALAAFDYLAMVDFVSQEGTLRIRYAKYAELLITASPLLIAAAIYSKAWKRFAIQLLPGCVAWIAAMLSLSKGAFLAGIIGFIVFFLGAAVLAHPAFRSKVVAAFCIWLGVTIAFQFGVTAFTAVPSTTDYISGTSDPTRETTSMRIFTWRVALEMVKIDPALGVGADNFGIAVNEARKAYSAENPNDLSSTLGEDYVFERAHNEPLQIFAELGIVGFVLFFIFVLAAVWFLIVPTIRSARPPSPLFLGAVAGCLAFAVSSMFSSFSFRAYQNGVVFFIVLGTAFALVQVGKSPSRLCSKIAELSNHGLTGAGRIAALAIVGSLLLFSALKAAGHFTAYSAERASTVERSERLFNASLLLDPDLPGSELALAGQAERRGDWNSAANHYKQAIDGGLGISLIYSYLSDSYEKAGEPSKAEEALAEALSIFPRSVFLRTRLATTLARRGKSDEAGRQMKIARDVDMLQANTWYSVLEEGILAAHTRSRTDKTFVPPAELLPAGAILHYAGGFDQIPVATP